MDIDKGWLLPPERLFEDQPKDWTDETGRVCLKAVVEAQLKELFGMTKKKEMRMLLLRALVSLNTYYDVNERVIMRHEAKGVWDRFRMLHRRLAWAASEFSALAAGRPEAACNAFKARQVNRILLPL